MNEGEKGKKIIQTETESAGGGKEGGLWLMNWEPSSRYQMLEQRTQRRKRDGDLPDQITLYFVVARGVLHSHRLRYKACGGWG
jgi:hypothetical protein